VLELSSILHLVVHSARLQRRYFRRSTLLEEISGGSSVLTGESMFKVSVYRVMRVRGSMSTSPVRG
jgi:hypothetical protein